MLQNNAQVNCNYCWNRCVCSPINERYVLSQVWWCLNEMQYIGGGCRGITRWRDLSKSKTGVSQKLAKNVWDPRVHSQHQNNVSISLWQLQQPNEMTNSTQEIYSANVKIRMLSVRVGQSIFFLMLRFSKKLKPLFVIFVTFIDL